MKTTTKPSVRTAGIAIAVAVLTIGLAGCSTGPSTISVQNVDSSLDQITVTGKSEVKITPDVAEIVYSVFTKAETAVECQTENAKSLDAAIKTLTGLGVEEKSIQTSSYGLNPVKDWNSSEQKITGYEMTTRITVSDIPVEEAGHILSESVAAGVNGIDSVNYYSSNYDEAYQEALKGAMEESRVKAEAIAAASGRSSVDVCRVEEYGYNPTARNSTYQAAKTSMMESAAAGDMAVMPGELTVEAQVTVDYTMFRAVE